eukprot:scaffold38805_cov64-Phaeocystis_antarctica.AAC.1
MVGGEHGPSVGVRSGESKHPRGESAVGCWGITSTSRAEVRTKPRSQARWRMRQCFRTASRDAYSRAHPGCLHTNRCELPVTVIRQQSTAAMPLVASD